MKRSCVILPYDVFFVYKPGIPPMMLRTGMLRPKGLPISGSLWLEVVSKEQGF